MAKLKQLDCLQPVFFLLKHITLWPPEHDNILRKYYYVYSLFIITLFIGIFDICFTISFLKAPNDIKLIITETIFYFTEVPVVAKIITLFARREKLYILLNTLESDSFQPKSDAGFKSLTNAKKEITIYFKFLAFASVFSWFMLLFQYAVPYLFFNSPLVLPVSRFYFLSDEVRNKYLYYLFVYQMCGMYIQMMTNLNVDSLIVGIMRFAEAQLEILGDRLSSIKIDTSKAKFTLEDEASKLNELKQCIVHYIKIEKYCNLIQSVFSETIFVVFGIAACIICIIFVCFTLEMSNFQTSFMIAYFFAMTSQIIGPCWLGTQIMIKSQHLGFAAYCSDWPSFSKEFKCNLIIFAERCKRPFSILGGKMFYVSLGSFTSIMKTAYSFFAVLQKMEDGQKGDL